MTAAFPLCGVLVNATATLMAKITSKGNAVTAMSVHGAPCVGIGCLASSGIEAPHVSQNLLPELILLLQRLSQGERALVQGLLLRPSVRRVFSFLGRRPPERRIACVC